MYPAFDNGSVRFQSTCTLDFFAVLTVFIGGHLPVMADCTSVNPEIICRLVLRKPLRFHFLYFCVHLYSFHFVHLPHVIFFLLYHIRLSCTLSGEILYTFWRIPVHSFWRFSVCFIILLTLILLLKYVHR